MNFVIDPDVLHESFSDFACRSAIVKIGAEIRQHRFYRDSELVLENEYRSIFNHYFASNTEHPTIQLLQQMLFDDGNPETIISGCCETHHRDRLTELGCTSPVEPELIGMLSRARNLGLILLLVGMNTGRTRPRGLHSSETFRCVGKMFPWLEVSWAGKSKVDIPMAKYQDDEGSHQKAKEFESKSSLWLQDQDIDHHLRCITPPSKDEIGGEQIDVYGYRRTNEHTTLVVGECKLRREGNEAMRPIEHGEIQKLRRKLIAAREYEISRKRRTCDGDTPSCFEGLLISNATDLEDAAKEFINSETEFPLRFLSVVLPKGWETKQEWRILSVGQRYPSEQQ